ncbi:MAG TPA: hypothetical protein H9848_07570 [Candidatus Parabacteroides intestinigallinarum]|uniref:Uncharacterized protein n=1 Tax=Candidatus Parabacteroides intestinigallinarum TaxID=2838722 RepID=A0A9D1XSC1_9BACT|nr:hypothetical protein [Candidatus Parabacteroides intestinigallinarum]
MRKNSPIFIGDSAGNFPLTLSLSGTVLEIFRWHYPRRGTALEIFRWRYPHRGQRWKFSAGVIPGWGQCWKFSAGVIPAGDSAVNSPPALSPTGALISKKLSFFSEMLGSFKNMNYICFVQFKLH